MRLTLALLAAMNVLTLACTPGGDATTGSVAQSSQGAPAQTVACPESGPRDGGAGAELPDVTLPCLGNPGSLGLRELPAKPVVLNLWASWCRPCREEMPALQGVHRAAGDRVLFLGIDIRDGEGAGRSFVQDFGVTYPSLYDREGKSLNQLGATGLPLTLVLAADGTVLDRTLGGINQDKLVGVLERAGVPLDRSALGTG